MSFIFRLNFQTSIDLAYVDEQPPQDILIKVSQSFLFHWYLNNILQFFRKFIFILNTARVKNTMILLWLNLLLLLNMVNLLDQVKLISMLQRIKNLPFPKSLSLQFKFAYWCHIEDIRNNVRTTCNYVFTFIALKYDFY